MSEKPKNGLSAQDFHSARAEIATESVKGLFLMNGGGAVSLLAFVQSVWEKDPNLSKYSLFGIASMAFGCLSALLVNPFRYHTSFNFQAGRAKRYRVFQILSFLVQYLSVIAFTLGAAIVVWGGLAVLRDHVCLLAGPSACTTSMHLNQAICAG